MVIDDETLELIKQTANEKIDLVFSELGIDLDSCYSSNNEIRCKCPVHDGNNPTAFRFDINTGNWQCYTKKCHENHWNILGLVSLMLGKEGETPLSWLDSARWLANLLNIDIAGAKPKSTEDRELSKEILKLKRKTPQKKENKFDGEFPIPLSLLRDKLKPSQYFLDKGFSKEVLDKYYVGFCDNPNKPMYLRSYSLVLDDAAKNVVGITGRTQLNECEICGLYHEQGRGCPADNIKVRRHSKWFHYKFLTSQSLYGSWYAKEYIQKSSVAILCEGTKNVWWLDQHGIKNSVCCFGLSVSEFHVKKLLEMNTLKVVLAMDNDSRGIEGAERIENELKHYFKVIKIQNHMEKDKDIADINSTDMNKILVPYLKSLEPK